MTERRRSAWSIVADEWDPDRDPAQLRMREALALRPVDAPGPSDKAEVAPDTFPAPQRATEESTARRGRIAQLVARIRAGDLSAVDLLKELLP